MKRQQIIIIGASSGIAQALKVLYLQQHLTQLILVSRSDLAATTANHDQITNIKVEDYSAKQIQQAINKIKQLPELAISHIFICNGLLHSMHLMPEKCIENVNAENFLTIINANTLTPILWLQALFPLIAKQADRDLHCKLVVFSARVGSISDNHLGGWYSYRSSKAALNMFLKTFAIELARRAKHCKLIAFHPGTTDTNLSKPFQKNVAVEQLFSPEFVANQLKTITESLTADGEMSYLDWQGKSIPW